MKKKIFEQISDQIRELIFSGMLEPGDDCPPEKELSKQFNTARLVRVREALRILEQSGLVSVEQGERGRGTFIKALDATAISRSISTGLVKCGNLSAPRGLTETRLCDRVGRTGPCDTEDYLQSDLVLLRKNIEEMERQLSDGVSTKQNQSGFPRLYSQSVEKITYLK